MLDSWIRIDADNRVTVFTGKCELGQGIKTALIQVAAEELVVEPRAITLVTADTARTPNEGYTAGSQSMQDSGTAIRATPRRRCARSSLDARGEPVRRGRGGADRAGRHRRRARRPPRHLRRARRGRRRCTSRRGRVAAAAIRRRTRVIGKSMQRVDIPAKVTGGAIYVHDLRLPGMVHARVRAAAELRRAARVGRRRRGQKHARRAEGRARRQLPRGRRASASTRRSRPCARLAQRREVGRARRRCPTCPADLYARCWRLPAQDVDRRGAPRPRRAGAQTHRSDLPRPYQMHASIGPSCAVAQLKDGMLTVWSHTQGVYPAARGDRRDARACPSRARALIHMEGAGCYGHNGADDAAADAALIATTLPGAPVRVQWMREDEHRWEPYGSAMVREGARRARRGGRIVELGLRGVEQHALDASGRRGRAARRRGTSQTPFTSPRPKPAPQPDGRRRPQRDAALHFPNTRVVHHFMPDMPLRVSALRALGAYHNVFAIESFMDELAQAAGADRSSSACGISRIRARATCSASRPSGSAGRMPQRTRGRGQRLRLRALQEPRRLLRRGRAKSRSIAKRGRIRLVRAVCCRSTAARPSIPTASATRSRAASCSRRAGRCTRRCVRPHAHHEPRLEPPIRSCASRACPKRRRAHRRSAGPAFPRHAARRRRARPRRRSPTPSPTRSGVRMRDLPLDFGSAEEVAAIYRT